MSSRSRRRREVAAVFSGHGVRLSRLCPEYVQKDDQNSRTHHAEACEPACTRTWIRDGYKLGSKLGYKLCLEDRSVGVFSVSCAPEPVRPNRQNLCGHPTFMYPVQGRSDPCSWRTAPSSAGTRARITERLSRDESSPSHYVTQANPDGIPQFSSVSVLSVLVECM